MATSINKSKSKQVSKTLEGVVFDIETQHLLPRVKNGENDVDNEKNRLANLKKLLLSIAVTWDKNKGFRVWKENNVDELVNYLSSFLYIVGANLMGFDYPVLEHYVPKIRSRLGRKTIDILTHARWGLVLKRIDHVLEMAEIDYDIAEPKEWDDFLDRLRLKLMPYGLSVNGKHRIIPATSRGGFHLEFSISLDNLAIATLRRSKLGKSASAPKLFAEGKLQELISYCERDVALTRKIFTYGMQKGYVRNKYCPDKLSVWWRELVDYYSRHPVIKGGSTLEAENFAWQVNHIKSSIISSQRVGTYISDWKSVARKVMSSYKPTRTYIDAATKMLISKLDDDGVLEWL